MRDKIVQIEVILNFLNTLFAKANYFKDNATIKELGTIRHDVYYGDFDYSSFLGKIKVIESKLKKYE